MPIKEIAWLRGPDYGVNWGDDEKTTIVRDLWRKSCGLFAEHREIRIPLCLENV